ncbi:MAG: hypothetical protein IT373_32670 [Polyangiaceae bacterium]|nr:hypothetical protein [Polyangiaceae bacterium]
MHVRRSAGRLGTLALLLAGTGCVSARASIGPTTDFGGHYGLEVLAGLGFGAKTTDRSTANFSVNAGGGLYPETQAQRLRGEPGPKGCFVDEIGVDHIWMPEGPALIYRVGARGGFRAVFDGGDAAAGAGAPPEEAGSSQSSSVGSVGGVVAVLPVISESHDGGDFFRDTWVGVGPELEIDYVVRDGVAGAHGRLSLALELDALSEW